MIKKFVDKKVKYLFYNRNYFVLVVCVIPIILGLIYVILFGVNVIFWDQWSFVPILEKMHSGSITLKDLFAQHNEHRIFFPRIIMLLLAFISKYNNIIEMIFTQFLLLIELVTFYLIVKRDYSFRCKNVPLWFIPLPFLVFSWRQTENMLWGFQISFIMPLIASILSFYFIEFFFEKKKQHQKIFFFILAICFAIISSYSSIMGLFVWFAGMIQIFLLMEVPILSFLSPFRDFKKKYLLYIWILVGISVCILYFTGYNNPEQHKLASFILFKNPILFFKYFIICLGGFFTHFYDSFVFASFLLFLLSITILASFFNKSLKRKSFWIAIIIFTLLTILSIALGRAGFGLTQGLSSRYSTYSIAFTIAVYIIVFDTFNYKNDIKNSFVLGSFIGLLFFGSFISYFEGYKQGCVKKEQLISMIPSIIRYREASNEELIKTNPDPDKVRQEAKMLENIEYNVFNKNSKYYLK